MTGPALCPKETLPPSESAAIMGRLYKKISKPFTPLPSKSLGLDVKSENYGVAHKAGLRNITRRKYSLLFPGMTAPR